MAGRGRRWLVAAMAFLALTSGCGGGAFSERHEIEIDGSGRSLLRFADAAADLEALRAGFVAPGVRLVGLREESGGTVLAEVDFDSPGALCAAPAVARECRYTRTPDGGYELWIGGPVPGSSPPGRPTAGPVQVRVGARVTFHNSPGPPRRGNLLAWPREDGGAAPGIRIVTEGRTVLAYAFGIASRSLVIATAILAGALVLLFIVGRRRLAAPARGGDSAPR